MPLMPFLVLPLGTLLERPAEAGARCSACCRAGPVARTCSAFWSTSTSISTS
ncbi:MAG: hypothetical protein U0Z44_14570 [Kouleothrix sp.]